MYYVQNLLDCVGTKESSLIISNESMFTIIMTRRHRKCTWRGVTASLSLCATLVYSVIHHRFFK